MRCQTCVCVRTLPFFLGVHTVDQLVSLVDQRHQLLKQQLLSVFLSLRLLTLCRTTKQNNFDISHKAHNVQKWTKVFFLDRLMASQTSPIVYVFDALF